MEIILIVLTSAIISAFFIGFFLLGYYVRDKKPNNEGVTVTEQNKEFIEEMMRWRNYGGK